MEFDVEDCREVIEHIQSCDRCKAWLLSVITKAANLEFLDTKDKKEN